MAEEHAARRRSTGVGVGVEMYQRDVAVDGGNRPCIWPGDGVIATEDDRHRAVAGDGLDGLTDALDRFLHVTRGQDQIPNVDDIEHGEGINPGGQMRPRAVEAEVVAVPYGFGTETSSGSVRRAPVERRADDDHLGAAQVVDLAGGNAGE